MIMNFPYDTPRTLSSLSEVTYAYKAVVCDLWGVLHDGVSAHRSAVEALMRYRQTGGCVVLLSNSPRPSAAVESQLRAMGIPSECYNAITTSGDLAQQVMNSEFTKKRYFHLGPQRDKPTIDGIAALKVDDVVEADVVLCTGLFEDEGLSLEQHDDVLHKAHSCGIEMICANPDRVVDYAERRVYCAGSLADRYERIGGMVRWLGKPYDTAYQAVFSQIERHVSGECDLEDVLAIGDSLVTDIAGANHYGIDSLLITEGLHKAELKNHASAGGDDARLQVICRENDAFPNYSMALLR